MTKGIKLFYNFINAVTEKISKPASFLVFIMMAITATEVIARYVFNHPTAWAWPLNRQIFGLFILVAGAFTMSKNEHIRIEILYDHFPPKHHCTISELLLHIMEFLMKASKQLHFHILLL